MNDITAIKNTVIESIPDVLAIYQFGSVGTAYERPDSDIDIAVLPGKRLSAEVRLALTNKLMDVTKREYVDLIDLSTANTVLIFQIITQGKRIYCADENACETYESLEFSKYVRLNEERAGIIEDIKKRGNVYGE